MVNYAHLIYTFNHTTMIYHNTLLNKIQNYDSAFYIIIIRYYNRYPYSYPLLNSKCIPTKYRRRMYKKATIKYYLYFLCTIYKQM